jgi:predicted peroxiredoxin
VRGAGPVHVRERDERPDPGVDPAPLAANGSLEAGQTPVVALVGDAAEIVIGDNAERIEGLGVPPVRDLIRKLSDHEVPVYV